MPRSERPSRRRQEAQRLRRLREEMGLSQREMAAELRVAHGAVGLWESGARTIPGPVLKLMELYENELGLDGPNPEKPPPLTKLPTSRLSRSWKLGRSAAGTTARAAALALDRLFAGEERTNAIGDSVRIAVARRMVETLGEMKGFAMKVGQMAGYLDFALPEAAREVLATLQATTRPMAPSVVARVFLEDLGALPRELFAEWSPRPFAAASIGQVHRARLRSGEAVAVKVQYPGVRQAILADLGNARLVDGAARLVFRAQKPGVILEEVKERFLEECDYRLEASHQDAFRRRWAGRPGVVVPRVFPELGSARILVTELCEGQTLAAFVARASQADKSRAGVLIWDFAFESVFRHQVFNADPHPGNFLFGEKGVVTFVDFGCVSHFAAEHVERWKAMIRAHLERDHTVADRLWVEMGMVPDPARYDFEHHRAMMRTLYEPWLQDRPFRFDGVYVQRLWNATSFENRNRSKMNVPREWVFAHRLESGLYTLLAKLEATANWRRRILDLVYGPGERRPPAFSRREFESTSGAS